MNAKTNFSKGLGIVTIIGLLSLMVGASFVSAPQVSASGVLLVSVAITASPGTICVGQSSHITWSSTDATSISIDQGIGSVLPYGDRYVLPAQTTTYTITGTNTTGGFGTAQATVFVAGQCPTPTPTWTPTPSPTPYGLYCTPAYSSANSGDVVIFSANYSYNNGNFQQSPLRWSAAGGYPSTGNGSMFSTRFYTSSVTSTQMVTVTDGYQTASCTAYVYGNPTPTPTPTPVDTLRCYSDMTNVDSGQRVTFRAYGGDSDYRWYASDGSPSSGFGSTLMTGFYNNSWYSQYRSATVTSGWQTATCAVTVNAGATWTPTPYPTPTWTPYPTPTIYPYVDLSARVALTGRNVTRGQSGEYASLTARDGDTLDLIIHVRSTTGAYIYNAYVTDLLPSVLTYIAGSTTLNGYSTVDGITSSGINVGTLSPYSDTVVKLSALVSAGSVPTWGTVTVNDTAQVRADGVGTMSAQLPITLGANASIGTISSVKTGPADSLWMALVAAVLVTGGYAAYARSDMFGRRMALSEISRLSRTSGLNFVK